MSSDGILEGGGVKFGMKDPSFQHVGPQLSDIRLSGKLVLGEATFRLVLLCFHVCSVLCYN